MADETRAIFRRDGTVTVAGYLVGEYECRVDARGRTHIFTATDGKAASTSQKVMLQAAALASYNRIKERNPLGRPILIHV